MRTAKPADSIARAFWSVMWVKKGQIYERKFEGDLCDALDLYTKLNRAGRKAVTLRSCNVAFPPPDRYLNAEYEEIEVKRIRRGKHRGKKVRVKVTKTKNIMGEFNLRGLFWCPYCMKLRKFRHVVEGDRFKLECPMCDITTNMWAVKRWNPQAAMIEHRKARKRGSKADRSRRRR